MKTPNKEWLSNVKELAKLTLEKEETETKIKKLREVIITKMKGGDDFSFVEPESKITFIIKLQLQDVAVLKPNDKIFKLLGVENFISIAKINKTELDKQFGAATTSKCIASYNTKETLVLRKEK